MQEIEEVFDLNGTTTLDRIDEAEKRATLHADTSFVFMSAALVFIMTPGLGYFYSGMARSKTALSLIMICFLTMAVVFVQVKMSFVKHFNSLRDARSCLFLLYPCIRPQFYIFIQLAKQD